MKQKVLCLFLAVSALSAQLPELVFRAQTRVLTVDVMVQDTATSVPATNLKAVDFQMLIDGRERPISYFSQGGQQRRPLALLVFFNLASEGGLRQLSEQNAQVSFAAALARLNEADEVAVYATQNWFAGESHQFCALTPDRDKAARALEKAVTHGLNMTESEHKRENRSRDQSMKSAVNQAVTATALRPASQIAMVYVSDGVNTLDTMKASDRRDLSEILAKINVSFSALDLRMLANYAALASVLNPIGKAFGMSVTGGVDDLSRQTGGITVQVPRHSGIGEGFESILTAYTSRYSLGYQLAESEFDDAHEHRISVVLRSAASNNRRVSARRIFVAQANDERIPR